MKTREKIKELVKRKYGITISEYEKRMGFSNGALKKDGQLKADRLYIIAQDLCVSMETLLDDDIVIKFETEEEIELKKRIMQYASKLSALSESDSDKVESYIDYVIKNAGGMN